MSLNGNHIARNSDVIAIARWVKRIGLPLTILAWAAVTFMILWLLGYVVQTLFLLSMAALLAYALSPAVKFLERAVPRFVAILLVYLLVLGLLSALLYLIIHTAVAQLASLSEYIRFLLTPGKGGASTPIEQTLLSFGISQSQYAAFRTQILGSIEGLAGSIVPLFTGFVGALLDIILVAVVSIYILSSGSHIFTWLHENIPLRQQGRMKFLVDTLQHVIGGYIRGQLLLCVLVGLLVGFGMQVIGIPYALLVGVLAFILEFIPILGTLVSGAICILLALTHGWIIALIVLVYFVVVHIIEGDVIGPRIIGKSIGLHPIVSLAALIAGSELFGITGALFASPIAGVLQAILVALWLEWKQMHPADFTSEQEDRTLDGEEYGEVSTRLLS